MTNWERDKALRLARKGVRAIDIARCLQLTLAEFQTAIKHDKQLQLALPRED